ncbi:hypothetical protein MSSIH_1149 [Methanosarcina siciliae HI350]|uniref:Uncharacterized protein n=1 Tax=Methanosarcina siciliae HI350 TaxID=1434119 RepID=A0A0E3PC01_9EURY|nr:hypothetical protein MSSIH_1149 [Methanosarcina siciliae HI350]
MDSDLERKINLFSVWKTCTEMVCTPIPSPGLSLDGKCGMHKCIISECFISNVFNHNRKFLSATEYFHL